MLARRGGGRDRSEDTEALKAMASRNAAVNNPLRQKPPVLGVRIRVRVTFRWRLSAGVSRWGIIVLGLSVIRSIIPHFCVVTRGENYNIIISYRGMRYDHPVEVHHEASDDVRRKSRAFTVCYSVVINNRLY